MPASLSQKGFETVSDQFKSTSRAVKDSSADKITPSRQGTHPPSIGMQTTGGSPGKGNQIKTFDKSNGRHN